MNIGQAALSYAARGFDVVPLHGIKTSPTVSCSCRRPKCASPGKHPLFSGWRTAATHDRRKVNDWWSIRPSANIGLAMGGERRLIALDIDGDAGMASLSGMEDLPPTWTQTTGRGEHRVFTLPDDFDFTRVRNRVSALDGIDVRAEGGYIVGAPSLHASGTHYSIALNVDPAPLPAWMFDAIVAAGDAAVKQDNQVRERTLDRLPHRDVRMRRATVYVEKMPAAIQGQNGSRACMRVAVALVRGFCLNREQAYEILAEDFNPRCAPPWSEVELWHKIDSAFSSITQIPWGYLLQRQKREVAPWVDDFIDALGR